MNKIVTQVAEVITSLGTVIFVLLMTVIAMIFVGHGLYYQVFIQCMSPWQAEMASWVLSFGIETTVLVITCNVKYFSSNRLPVFFAICSGFIVLFFINAFDFTQPTLDIAIRWFIGILVSGVNFVYAELFVKKYQESQKAVDLLSQIEILRIENDVCNNDLNVVKSDLARAEQEMKKLAEYVAELEMFRKNEIDRLTCSHCAKVFSTIYHLNSHRSGCEKNPSKGHKESAFTAVV
jgi:hypothetical protein